MRQIRVWAVGVDEVRALLDATGAVRDRLLADLGSTASRPSPPGRLGDLGPLLRHAPDAPVVPHGSPVRSDAERLLARAPVPAERLDATWALLEHWLDGLAWATTRLADEPGPRSLVDQLTPADLPLPARPGTSVGWLGHHDAVRLGRDRPGRDGPGSTGSLAGWLAQLPGLARQAQVAHRPEPDVLAVVEAPVSRPR